MSEVKDLSVDQRRVVITGIGAITPIGLGVEGLWQGLRRLLGIRPYGRTAEPQARSILAIQRCRYPHGSGRRGSELSAGRPGPGWRHDGNRTGRRRTRRGAVPEL